MSKIIEIKDDDLSALKWLLLKGMEQTKSNQKFEIFERLHDNLSGEGKCFLSDLIASAEFEKDLKKAIEEGNDVGYNADGGYDYFCEYTALREVLKVIKKHLL